jgi:hypothetical protein
MRLNSGSVVRSFGALALATLLAGPPLGIVAASAQAPTAVTDLIRRVPSCTNPIGCLFSAKQWGIMPTGFEFAALIPELSKFPVSDPVTGTSNNFFNASQYASDCNSSLYIINTPALPAVGRNPAKPAQQVPICEATSVPVVDSSFLNQLQAAGLQYHLVFPIQDNGNIRGYVVWNSSVPPFRAGQVFPSIAGYARIEGVTWQNQFQASGSLVDGDLAGQFIADQSSPVQQTALRLEVPGGEATLGTTTPIYAATMVTDAWLAGAPTPPVAQPPFPPAPAIVAGAPASPLNVGGPGVPANSGSSVAGNGNGRGDTNFDFAAFCNAPDSQGRPRSPTFVQACLSVEGQ